MSSETALVRSVFFYNQEPRLGSTTGLHFFEPRYRLLVQRLVQEPRRSASFVFLPNYSDYQARHGDIGYLAQVGWHRAVPSDDPYELPRADVQITFTERVIVLFHWVEPEAYGLCECLCRLVDATSQPEGGLPSDGVSWPSEAEFEQLIARDWPDTLGGSSVLPVLHGRDAGCHWLLHAANKERAVAALEVIDSDFPQMAPRVYPIIIPATESLLDVGSLLRHAAAIHMRLAPPEAEAEAAAAAEQVEGGASTGNGGAGALGGAAADGASATADMARLSQLPLKELRARLRALHVAPSEMEVRWLLRPTEPSEIQSV